MYDLNNTYLDIEKNKNGIAILPVGAIEQHGPHLPISVDHFQAESVSRAVAERMDAFYCPELLMVILKRILDSGERCQYLRTR